VTSGADAVAIANCAVATVDDGGNEYASGYVVVEEGRIAAVGAGELPEAYADARRIDGRGTLITPGLVNTHHHLYQWITRGYAVDETLFGWLATLYPVWTRLTDELVHDAAAANLGWLALSGCTLSSDHHYVFPAGAGDLLAAEIAAAQRIGVRFHPARGSMNLGRSKGGLPPDEAVEDHDTILAATADAITAWHDPSPDAMVRIAVAPCSPFSVTEELMRDCATLAREHGVRLHTHLAETVEEEAFCAERFGGTSAQYAEKLGWLGADVWLAHCVHLSDDAIARFGATGTGVAHCPTSNGRLGAGAAPVRAMLDAGVPVGLGVDGAASNEANRLVDEIRQSLLVARVRGGPTALTAREALRMATIGGARCLGRDAELGSIEVGKLADLAVWRVDGLPGAGIADPVSTLAIGAAPLEMLLIGGRPIVEAGELRTADATQLAAAAATASATIAVER
jgi:cytosine/adenosine deaminase-related metal-dependent hydrolase